MSQLSPNTAPLRVFKDHTHNILAVAVFPDRCRMVTGSYDKTLLLWDLRTGVVLKKIEGHRGGVLALAVSKDGKMIASGDDDGEIIAWHGETGQSLTQPTSNIGHSKRIWVLEFSPDGTVLATGSADGMMKLWSTKTWQMQGNPIECGSEVNCIRYSPSGEHLAIATDFHIEILSSGARERVANFKGHTESNLSLAWTPDGTRLLTGCDEYDPSIREWDTSTWKQVGDPWKGHTRHIWAIDIHPAGTLVASASSDNHVRLWRLSDGQTIAIYQHSAPLSCVTFSIDGKHILSGGHDTMISEWEVPKDALPEEAPEMLALKTRDSDAKILIITTTARNACIAGDLSAAEEILTQEIDADANNHTSYANRSLVMARKLDWDRALQDATKSLSIRPSLTGYVAKGIALCGTQQLWDAMKVFDLAFTFTFTDGDSKTNHLLFLIKAIALFNVNRHEEAMLPIQELTTHPNPDPLVSRVVEAYLRVQLGTIAMDAALHKEAADHFTAAVNAGIFYSKFDIHSMYEDFVVLFGWDLKSLWQIANQQRYHALFRAGQIGEALEAYRYMMDMSDETTRAIFLAWVKTLNEQ